MTFIQNPFNKKEVNHKNKDKTDNSVANLEWSNGMENTQHKLGRGVWNSRQNRISPSTHSVSRRKLEGFSQIIIPQIHKLVPLD